MIGILIVGLHQGQRTYAPHRQAGHMTAADQIVRSGDLADFVDYEYGLFGGLKLSRVNSFQ